MQQQQRQTNGLGKQHTSPVSLVAEKGEKRRLEIQVPSKVETEVEMREQDKSIKLRRTTTDRFGRTADSKMIPLGANKMRPSKRCQAVKSGATSGAAGPSKNALKRGSVERRVNRWLAICSKWPMAASLPQATLILLVVLVCIGNQINCDPNQQHQSTQLQPERNQSSLAANLTQPVGVEGAANASQPNNDSLEYRQRPNPAGSEHDTSTKISYDRQHELSAPTTTSSSSVQQPAEPKQEPAKPNATLIELANEKKPFAEVDASGQLFTVHQKVGALEQHPGVDEAAGQPTAELLVGVTGESAVSLDESAALDLDALSATSSSIISRHGRASSPSNSYTAPASSRLSAYTPMLLQNSRAHPRQPETGGQSTSLQVSNQAEVVQQQQRHSASAALATSSTRSPPSGPFDPIIVCYLGSWSVYRPSLAKFTPENINPFLCTHIIYAFAGLSSKFELRPFDSYNDITQGGYRKFTGLKEYNKQLKTLIAVGGWNEGSAR